MFPASILSLSVMIKELETDGTTRVENGSVEVVG
jgi:hypothetical protein